MEADRRRRLSTDTAYYVRRTEYSKRILTFGMAVDTDSVFISGRLAKHRKRKSLIESRDDASDELPVVLR